MPNPHCTSAMKLHRSLPGPLWWQAWQGRGLSSTRGPCSTPYVLQPSSMISAIASALAQPAGCGPHHILERGIRGTLGTHFFLSRLEGRWEGYMCTMSRV